MCNCITPAWLVYAYRLQFCSRMQCEMSGSTCDILAPHPLSWSRPLLNQNTNSNASVTMISNDSWLHKLIPSGQLQFASRFAVHLWLQCLRAFMMKLSMHFEYGLACMRLETRSTIGKLGDVVRWPLCIPMESTSKSSLTFNWCPYNLDNKLQSEATI